MLIELTCFQQFIEYTIYTCLYMFGGGGGGGGCSESLFESCLLSCVICKREID